MTKKVKMSVPEGMEFGKSYTIPNETMDTTLHNKYYWDTDRNMPHKSKEAEDRKRTPVFSGVLNYFPDAIKEIARVSLAGNEQHHPGTPLHWDRDKSTDELDALSRHLIDAGTFDSDGIRHSAKVAWRALANLQKELENEK
tara:strand:+ start:123 stop:545 length:423 start_codon:yes stop_codon:yes gene_type:complete